MTSGSPWSEGLIRQIADDKEERDAFAADQVRVRLAEMIRTLREQPNRQWTQSELGARMGKPQSVVSRIEDPEYGKLALQTLFDVAAAFDLPLWIDFPEWEEWLRRISEVRPSALYRRGFNPDGLISLAHANS